MKHALFLVFISLFMPYAHAKEAWIDPSKYFDEEDKKIFSFLKTNTDDAGSFQCLEISSWAKEKDKEKKHIYREIKDFGQMYASSKECKRLYLDSLELMAPAACIYKEGYSMTQ
ncbi:MAG: hypothetical protein M9962_05825 [Oligoflexia bacterium]|nr:hypothetical protein [Oligoflexia bacterium]